MHLTIKRTDKPDAPGFIYRPSKQTAGLGPDQQRQEMLQTLHTHVNVFFTQELGLVNGEDVTVKIPKSVIVAELWNDDGSLLEKLEVK